MDPIRNPYAPGAGQRPPELAGRDGELQTFDVVLERVARGRPERSIVLTGLRGVGKTVLLNAMRSAAVRRSWGTGKLEARPDQPLRHPLAAALHLAIRELGAEPFGKPGPTVGAQPFGKPGPTVGAQPFGKPGPTVGAHADETRQVLGVLKAFAQKSDGKTRWQPGIDVPAVSGRADSGDIETDLIELFGDIGGLAADVGRGVAVFLDEMQDLAAADVSALCAACHEISQQGLPLVVVGAGLPHLPAVLSASKSYSERLFRYARIDRLDRVAADAALVNPAREEDADFTADALAAMYEVTGGYPYFVQAYGKAAWDVAPGSPITDVDVKEAAPLAEAELAVGFFGSRYERATPAEREYLRAMAEAADKVADPEADSGVPTALVAELLGRNPQSLSPARDALLKKGLVYSGQRGRIAFTVPHFGRYLRQQD